MMGCPVNSLAWGAPRGREADVRPGSEIWCENKTTVHARWSRGWVGFSTRNAKLVVTGGRDCLDRMEAFSVPDIEGEVC